MDMLKKGEIKMVAAGGFTAADSNLVLGSKAATIRAPKLKQETTAQKIAAWYIEPLRAMNVGRQGFLILMVLFPLYEKYLRIKEGMGDEGFGKGKPVIDRIRKELEFATIDEAFGFWQDIRNGLLHRAIPKAVYYKLGLQVPGPAIESCPGGFLINPFELRDRILSIIEADMSIWDNDSTVQLPESYE
ncbi:MAG TPA: hypothetical protein VKX17_24620 [Planctomycetota bacterium]|nr:hypothetical protein [Planctomycetota bacterium]